MKKRYACLSAILVVAFAFGSTAFAGDAPAEDTSAPTAWGHFETPFQDKMWEAMSDEASREGETILKLAESPPSQPAQPQGSLEELAKKTQNPISDLISVPFQSNFNFYDIHTHVGGRDFDRNTMGYLLNIQPIVPFTLNEDWNLVTRTIIPVINQPEIFPGVGSHGGLGDIQFTAFFGPSKPSKFVWAAGPVFLFPTATDDALGSGKWSAGPSAVAVWMEGPWVIGVLTQNVWSYAGDSDRNEVNQMLIQPFVNYNLPKGWYVATSPMITADWHAASDERWTVPLGAAVGKLFRLGRLPINASLGAYYNVEHPTFAPTWSIRFQIQFLLPK